LTVSQKIYQLVTDRILALLEQGVVPWKKHWRTSNGSIMPVNLVSRRPYRGVNVFILVAQGFSTPYWLTFKQTQDRGGRVRRGERGTPIVFWRIDQPTTEETNREESPTAPRVLLRYYTVFNVEQCDGIEIPVAADGAEFNPIPACEAVYANMPNPPELRHMGEKAFYRRRDDLVQLPRPEAFSSPEHYYSTQAHELAHNAEARFMPRRKLTPWDYGAFRQGDAA
jgi:antirestriction protein ArdC